MKAVKAKKNPDGEKVQLRIGKANFGVPSWGSEVIADFLYAYPGSPAGLGDETLLRTTPPSCSSSPTENIVRSGRENRDRLGGVDKWNGAG